MKKFNRKSANPLPLPLLKRPALAPYLHSFFYPLVEDFPSRTIFLVWQVEVSMPTLTKNVLNTPLPYLTKNVNHPQLSPCQVKMCSTPFWIFWNMAGPPMLQGRGRGICEIKFFALWLLWYFEQKLHLQILL